MFTGIVEATGEILSKTEQGLSVSRPKKFDDIEIGGSIAVAGVCLSIVELLDDAMRFDIVPETWEKTNLAGLQKGDEINLERSMQMGDRFEGHIVQGHVEGIATVKEMEYNGKKGSILRLEMPEYLSKFIVHKGSIAIDGVSLTVADIDQNLCSIALIPHTLDVTTLGDLKKGDHVNIETDILVRYAMKLGITA